MFIYPKIYDVIVVGAGHAGVEAALAAARLGCRTLLLTMNLDTIGQMSCNPAIGGLAKGHLVREIDALGGEMGLCTDMTGIQFRMLNTRKGPSVWAPRAQCDKKAYQLRLKRICERQENLDCLQGLTTRLLFCDGSVSGIETALATQFRGKCVVLTTGTFLRALMHIGQNQQTGGRLGEPAAMDLSNSLRQLGMEVCRLKTGTPPRLRRNSVDASRMSVQPGDEPPPFFSHWSRVQSVCSTWNHSYPINSLLERVGGQVPCYLTHTTAATAALVRNNLQKSAMFSGAIKGTGPRYCPSIEDKIVRFAEKNEHQIFLEPEGVETDELYLNGLSTSFPQETQIELVQSIVGCEKAEIIRPAYAVEYDFAPPTQLYPSLESKLCRNLYCAGQINGTSGYEEAAAQGLIAGINAARRVKGMEEIVLRRDQAYIGVLIDDLVTRGTREPYRLFTSRAEFRLLLRQDNADFRLAELGHAVGLLGSDRFKHFASKRQTIETEIARLDGIAAEGSNSMLQILKRPEVKYSDLRGARLDLSNDVISQVEILTKYAGYIERQAAAIGKSRTAEEKSIPITFEYDRVIGLRSEAREKLKIIQPMTVGQAARISGVTPADISLLLVHLSRCGRGAA